MDTSDSNIRFDENGVSDYYHNFKNIIEPNWHTDEKGYRDLMLVAESIRKDGKNRSFDCIIGLSGGLDSSYTAYVAKEVMGLRPLLFHVDAGWNTQQAVHNIEKIVNGLNADLFTEVINWEEMKDLQLSFLKAQVPDQDIPQDCAFFSALYKFASKNRIKYVLTGGNYSTECCREPEEWGCFLLDSTFIYDIHKRFGKVKLNSFPIVDILTYKIAYRFFYGMKVFKPLNYLPFVKKEAEIFLEKNFGWLPFKHKHHESRFTRFFEDYWLPRKFGFEKRRAHFSSLILTGQMSRDEALVRISKPEMSESFLEAEFEYVASKLDIDTNQLRDLFNGDNRTYRHYKNKKGLLNIGTFLMRKVGMEKRLIR
jgi:N-acetyl sugar amidotransferase